MNSEIAAPGLNHDVEIIVDTWGVPHIYAKDRSDLFFAQGFNAARDRLFQIDLWRRRGLGRLAEVFGPEFVEQDRAARLFLYRGDMHTEWLAYGAATKSILTAFTNGVNSYVDWVGEDQKRLPPEFVAHGYLPEHWEPEDATRIRSHGLFYNAEDELARALMLRDFGPEAEVLRRTREPADPLTVPEGLDLTLLSDEVLRTYRLGRAPVPPIGSSTAPSATVELAGSNNWAISGERTATGRPILASDPHRAVTLPSLRYIAHLSAPGISIIGGGEPALPGVSIGHNGSVAFGLTIWPADQEDLYVYETNPNDPRSYRYQGGWERMTVCTETIAVAGESPQTVELVFTRHGPVLHEDVERGGAVALRAVWLEPGMAPYLASLDYLRAKSAETFVDALNRWGAPPVNHAYATTEGIVGCSSAAMVPIRPNWDGSLPVPGDGRYEWAGFYDADQFPSERGEREGWVASANQMNLPTDFENHERTITYDWYPSNRYQRISEVLAAGTAHSVEDSLRLQNDVLSRPAGEILAVLSPVPSGRIRERDEFRRLLGWSRDETTDSRSALVFQIWIRRHLRPVLLEHALRASGMATEVIGEAVHALHRDESFFPDLRAELAILRSFDPADPSQLEALTRLVDESLTAAVGEVEALLGADRDGWSWGRVHQAEIGHPLLLDVAGVPDTWKCVGPAPKAGSGDSVGIAAYDATFTTTLASTFRLVVDVGEWDESRAMNSPGQSGDPRSPHYGDLFDPWLRAESFPLCFSRESVEANAESRLILRAAVAADADSTHMEHQYA